ncbi:MAG: hypothetical protein ACT4PE_03485 [Candidatus Eiseniibacteriota bacterium]
MTSVRRHALALSAAALALSGCGGGGSGPAGPPPPDLTTPDGAILALEDFYSHRLADEAIALLAPNYRFFPAEPESLAFLGAGETSWDQTREVAILRELLVEERSIWIDQVLLEVTTESISYSSDQSAVDIEAKVELGLLLGVDLYLKAQSVMMMHYERDAEGNYLLVEEHESLFRDDDGTVLAELTVGEHKAAVLLGPGGTQN